MSRSAWPQGFRFRVEWDGACGYFSAASGLSSDPVAETGADRELQSLPGMPPRFGSEKKIVLERGILDDVTWITEVLGGDLSQPVERKTLTLTLRVPMPMAAMVWRVHKAYPLDWTSVGPQPGNDGIVVERLEFAFGSVTQQDAGTEI